MVTETTLEVRENVGFFDKCIQSPKDYTFCNFTEGAEEANKSVTRGLVEWFALFREANGRGFFPSVWEERIIAFILGTVFRTLFGIRSLPGAL